MKTQTTEFMVVKKIFSGFEKISKHFHKSKIIRLDLSILVLFFLAFWAINYLWFLQDNLPPHWDLTNHLSMVFNYLELLRAGKLKDFFWQYYGYYPPLLYQITAVFCLVWDYSLWTIRFVMLFFTLGCFCTVYLLGKKFFSHQVGMLAAMLTLLTPMIYVFSRDFLLDIPLAFLVLLAIYLLEENSFENKRRAFVLGIILGFGMLIKWTFGLFVFGPMLFYFLKIFHKKIKILQNLSNFFLMLLVAFFLAVPWYLLNLREFSRDAFFNAYIVSVVEKDPLFFTPLYFFYYLEVIINEYFYLPLFLGIIYGFYKLLKQKKWEQIILVGFIIFPAYLFFTFINNKDPRYITPLIPIFCLLLAFGIVQIRTKYLKFILTFSILILLTVQFLGSVFDLKTLSQKIAIASPIRYLAFYQQKDPPSYFQQKTALIAPVLGELVLYNPFSYFGRLPRTEDWQIVQVINQLKAGDKVFFDLDNDIYFNQNLLLYFAKIKNIKITSTLTIEKADILITKNYTKEKSMQYKLPNGKVVYLSRLSKT